MYSSHFRATIGLGGRVFANGLGNLGSIPGCVIPKTLKMVLDTSLLYTPQYKIRIKGKWSNPGKGLVLSPTPQYCRYWKGNLLVTLNYGRQLYLHMICKHILLITFLTEPKLIHLHTVKWFQVLLSITNNSIKQLFIYTQLNGQTVLFQTN